MDKAKNLMTSNPKTLTLRDTVRQALKLFVELGVHSIPILKDDARPIGILTEQSLVKAIVMAYNTGGVGVKIETVQQILDPVVCVAQSESFMKVTQKILSSTVNRVVVVDDDEKVIGIISPSDILKSFAAKEL